MEKKLNIGLFIDTFYPMVDGVVTVVDNYATKLSRFANVTVFCPYGKDKRFVIEKPYKVVRCKRISIPCMNYTIPTPSFDRKFKKSISDANLDLIHIHSPFGVGKMGVNYASKHNIPCIATLHSKYKEDFYKATKIKWLSNILTSKIIKVFNKCDVCWGVNEGVRQMFVDDYGLKAKTSVQPNGTSMIPFENPLDVFDEVNKKYNLGRDEVVLLFVGRLTVLKNILFIADALKIVKNAGYKFKMIYVGCGFDEKLLQKRIEELDLCDEVMLVGRVVGKDLQAIYLRGDLLLFPSPYDTDGLVKYEAACNNTPTLSIKGFHCSCNIVDNVNGYLSENKVEDFAKRIIEVISNKQELERVGINAKKDLYVTWDKVIDKVYNDYKQIILEKKSETE